MRELFLYSGVSPFCFNEMGDEGGASGAGNEVSDDNQTPGDAGDAQQGDDGGQGDVGAVKIYRPEGLPDHYVGENDQQTIDKMHRALDGFRKQQSDLPPSKADEYAFEEPDDYKGKLLRLGEDGKDPIVEKMKEVAHKFGMGKGQFQEFALEFSKSVFEMQQEQAAADGELTDFSYSSFGGEEAAKPVADGVRVWAQGMKNQGIFDDAEIDEIEMTISHDAGLRLLSKIREATGEKPIPTGEDAPSGGNEITKDILNQRVADPRYRAGSPEFDPVFYKETTEMFSKFYSNA